MTIHKHINDGKPDYKGRFYDYATWGVSMEDYNVEDRLITKDDWENWLKLREEYSRKSISKYNGELRKRC